VLIHAQQEKFVHKDPNDECSDVVKPSTESGWRKELKLLRSVLQGNLFAPLAA